MGCYTGNPRAAMEKQSRMEQIADTLEAELEQQHRSDHAYDMEMKEMKAHGCTNNSGHTVPKN
eukprot:10431821-Heterocapsa_arctica.AAC.1